MQAQVAATIRPKVRCCALGLALALAVWGGGAAQAQDIRAVVMADSVWTAPAQDLSAMIGRLSADGWLLARADSVRADTAFVTLGPRARVGQISIVGAEMLDGPTRGWSTQPGGVFRPDSLRGDLQRTAARYASIGLASAQIVPDLQISEDGATVDVTVRIDEGPASPVVAVELVGGRGPNRAFASRRAGLNGPTAPADLDRQQIRRSLEASGLYTEVGDPTFALDGADLILQVPVVEAPPGVFDVVLGYLPPNGGAGGGVVGRGRVDLRNLFGGGRTASAELERTPGLASSFAVDVSDPFAFGTPFGLGASFAGEARDSTLSRQRFGVDVRYPVTPVLEAALSLARESIRPGTFGAQEVDGAPRIRRLDEVLVGVGFRLQRVDAVRNPRRGIVLTAVAEQGRTTGGDAGARRRLTARSRGYLPTLGRQTLVLGADAVVTQRDAGIGGRADEGDLIRFGGATTFRGYDEASLLAGSYGRALAEYRLLFDDSSFAFGFVDAGVLDRPEVVGLASERRALFGYGAGVRVATGIGLATLTYALNPDLSAGRGKVHVGLAVGL